MQHAGRLAASCSLTLAELSRMPAAVVSELMTVFDVQTDYDSYRREHPIKD